MNDSNIENLCINTLRTLSIDMVEKANSGHPGLPLGAAPMAYVLFTRHLKFDPVEPKWEDRDRFVLSAGHGSALLYSMLHLCGYDVTMHELKSFRQMNSITPGHPEFGITPGVEATTGPLGQGEANAVGMAIVEKYLAKYFNRPGLDIINHFTYSLVSDGGLMEGVSAEAASLAGHLQLGKLIYLYDANNVCLDGPCSLTFSTENVKRRYESYGWQVLEVEDGNNDIDAIDKAISLAKAEKAKPSLIIVNTTIGYGSPNKADKSACHGSPLGAEELRLTKENLGCDPDLHFHVPDEVRCLFQDVVNGNLERHGHWREMMLQYFTKHPEMIVEWERIWSGGIPVDFDSDFPKFDTSDKSATRQVSKKILNLVAKKIPEIIGGAGDVAMSTLAQIDDGEIFTGENSGGRNIYFGVREHAMAAIANGMAYHGGVIPFVSCYFVFTDYMRPAMRLAAMNELSVLYILTHDSIAAGEDGPTHQPVEQLMSLRAMPDLTVIRPADAEETVEAWRWFLKNRDKGPVAFVLTRQKAPAIDRIKYASAQGLKDGAYILADPPDGKIDAIIIATGSEVHLAIQAHEKLLHEKIQTRVVSMPSWDLFYSRRREFRDKILPPAIKARVSIEAGATIGWERWIGCDGVAIGVDSFGVSAPGDEVMENFQITVDSVIGAVKKLV